MSRENLQASPALALSRVKKMLRLRDQEIELLKKDNKELTKENEKLKKKRDK